ncbi:hypothetical protein [Micromonospora sp. DT233]|uniref:hypothetical protein n=1 Tax=Micromonospora sp. DT233 TaxID=3393432 RepID=UPI003CEAB036
MRRRWLSDLLGTPFGLAVVGCAILAGWALWSGGLLDGPIARQVRTSSVYAAPGVDLDRAAAERVIGNRRLVVIMLAPGAELGDACDRVKRAADGTLVLVMARDGEDWDKYGCALLPERDKKNFGRAAVAETTIGQGTDTFIDRPLEAVKVVAVNYDRLVSSDIVPDGSRTVSPSLPRYLLAGAALTAVVAGAAALYVAGRRAGRLAAAQRARRDERADDRTALGAATAVLAQQIIDLEPRYAVAADTRKVRTKADREFCHLYLRLTSDYAALVDGITALDGDDEAAVRELTERVNALIQRAVRLPTT